MKNALSIITYVRPTEEFFVSLNVYCIINEINLFQKKLLQSEKT